MLTEIKQNIAEQIKQRMNERNLSFRKMSEAIEGIGTAQISRIINAENYNIETLIKILIYLELELNITPSNKCIISRDKRNE